MDIPILFEDGEALVINKPAGLPLDRARAGGAALDDYLPTLRLGFAREPVAVHRLEAEVSERPLTSIALAFGIGLLAAQFVRRS